MQLTILTENTAGGPFLAEHGLSYLIEHQGETILFDTGHSDVFLHNAELLGIDLDKATDTVVLSHGHWDHGDGLPFLQNKKLITHPLAFMKRYRRMNDSYLGLKMSKTEAMERFELITSLSPMEIKPNIYFLGQIPRKNDFEAQQTMFTTANKEPDFILDDSGLVLIDGDEIVVVTGCAHSGVCNMVNYAMQVSGISKVRTVIGGFHLKKDDDITRQTIDYLKEIGVANIYPSHCTELEAVIAFQKHFNITPLKTGQSITL